MEPILNPHEVKLHENGHRTLFDILKKRILSSQDGRITSFDFFEEPSFDQEGAEPLAVTEMMGL